MTVKERTIYLINGLSNYSLWKYMNEFEKWVSISHYIDMGMEISARQYASLERFYDMCGWPMPQCKVRHEEEIGI